MPAMKTALANKKVAVFGLGDQVSYSDNYADATGELFDVFESLGCRMMGAWSQEGYEHDDSKAIRGDKFCGLLLDMVNQEEMTEERVLQWVAQLKAEGFLEGGAASAGDTVATSPPMFETSSSATETEIKDTLEDFSSTLDENIALHSSGGFLPHYNPTTGKTMWTSADGKTSFVTMEEKVSSTY
jgi:flavodoxin I